MQSKKPMTPEERLKKDAPDVLAALNKIYSNFTGTVKEINAQKTREKKYGKK